MRPPTNARQNTLFAVQRSNVRRMGDNDPGNVAGVVTITCKQSFQTIRLSTDCTKDSRLEQKNRESWADFRMWNIILWFLGDRQAALPGFRIPPDRTGFHQFR